MVSPVLLLMLVAFGPVQDHDPVVRLPPPAPQIPRTGDTGTIALPPSSEMPPQMGQEAAEAGECEVVKRQCAINGCSNSNSPRDCIINICKVEDKNCVDALIDAIHKHEDAGGR